MLVVSYLAGSVIGVIYFGGLWVTVSKGLHSGKIGLWFLLSFVLRLAIALGGFYFVASGHWQRLAACLVGFLVVRFLFIKRIQVSQTSHAS